MAKVSEGSTLDAVRSIDGGKTELNVLGLSGDFDLAWYAAEGPVARVPTVLEASAAVLVRINGRTVNSDAKLTVRSLGGEFERFEVRLPPGAEFVGTPQPGALLVAIQADLKGNLYEVKLEKKTAGPFEIRLLTERTHDVPQVDEQLELAGFDVQGAVRQWGTVAVQVEGNWQVLWGQTNHVRQVDDLGGPLRHDDWTAGFEYFAQPYSLALRVVPQKTRISRRARVCPAG